MSSNHAHASKEMQMQRSVCDLIGLQEGKAHTQPHNRLLNAALHFISTLAA